MLLSLGPTRSDKARLMGELGDPEQFETLDTKLLAALSRIARGDLSRQILTLVGRVVRGRQVLRMFEQHFRTNEEAGASRSTEDLLKVVLHGNDLASFLHNWDSVVVGMKIGKFCDRFVDARRPSTTWIHTNAQKRIAWQKL